MIDIRIKEFVSTAGQNPDGSFFLTNNQGLIVVDQTQKHLKPTDNYLVTISKIHTYEEPTDETPIETLG